MSQLSSWIQEYRDGQLPFGEFLSRLKSWDWKPTERNVAWSNAGKTGDAGQRLGDKMLAHDAAPDYSDGTID